ncbi:MAG TPA: tRNA lysidine(34) synthetase TilS [Vicinamibacterales bacterium]|nr:tRNA lysidine(34) synthetase TilS [Vicinamibacterales bacterium]
MRDLARLVAGTITRHALAGADDRVAVAVSGGPDSVALVFLLREVAPDLGFALAGLIHVHHGLRGAEADGDEGFVRALADRLALPCITARADVASRARDAHQSIEAAARGARYEIFEHAARDLGATRVATGHTIDDQAETVLLRLLRGAGNRGLSGIRVRRGLYIRPLLECRRSELGRYLLARDESFREDASNLDRSIPRNRVRHDLLPVVEDLAPGGIPALARAAEWAADDEAFLEGEAIESARSYVLSDGAGVQLKVEGLAGLPPALARRVVRLAVESAAPGVTVAGRHLDAVRALAAAGHGDGHLDLPGLAVERRHGVIAIGVRGVGADEDVEQTSAAFEYPLPVPGEVAVPAAGATIVTSRPNGEVPGPLAARGGEVAVVQAASLALPLAVRSRRPGDRFRPLGAPGRRKVQDLFVDRKVPRSERDRVPIVVDADGRIVWVAGVTIAHECRVTAPSAGVVILELKRR